MINEDQFKQICLEWFCEGGYEYAFGPNSTHAVETTDCVALLTLKEVV